MHELKTLREVCDLLGVSRRAVQGYEKVGLVEPSGRNKYGYLLYDCRAVDTIRRIKQFQSFGFQIKEIRELKNLPKGIVREELQKKIVILETRRKVLDETIIDAKALLEKIDSSK